ncbi:hypothetical protein Lumi_027 [Xylophilus phage Lumi]|nr:hypothetical protein Lumi_027 [Xylophilus phage Lumi]
MALAIQITPTRFYASNGKLDTQRRYLFSAPGYGIGFIQGRTSLCTTEGSMFPGLSINGIQTARSARVEGIGEGASWGRIGVAT